MKALSVILIEVLSDQTGQGWLMWEFGWMPQPKWSSPWARPVAVSSRCPPTTPSPGTVTGTPWSLRSATPSPHSSQVLNWLREMSIKMPFWAGLVVFSILGHMAHVTHQDVSEIAAPGSGLAFIVYPEVVSRFGIRHPCPFFKPFCQNPRRPSMGRSLLLDADFPCSWIHIR